MKNKKIILSVLAISVLSIFLYINKKDTSIIITSAQITKNGKIPNNKTILHAIKNAGEDAKWRITEFKSNEVVAEKIDGKDSISASIKFMDGDIEFSNNYAASDLSDDIKRELTSDSTTH